MFKCISVKVKWMETSKPRIMRGYAILAKGDQPRPLGNNTYLVPSQSGNGDYHVIHHNSEWRCECPDHYYRKVECKHIHAVKFWLALKDKINQENEFTLYREIVEKPNCQYCGSPDVIKNGSRKTKIGCRQRFLCQECGKTFMVEEAFKKIVGDPKIVSLALDLYFKGISLRKIVDHLKQFYDVEVAHITVHRWIKRYMRLINAYVERLEPKLSRIWHADEMMVKAEGKWHWLWNIMDEETRFLLANMVSRKRDSEMARRIFQKAKETAKTKPEAIVTDGLHAYNEAYRKEFYTLRKPRTMYIRLPSIRHKPNNNVIERFHGTVRERDKVLRGLENEKTAKDFLEAFRTYYNFLRPHQALEGKTPAEKAGINLELDRNRWLSLIRKVATSSNSP
jgi:transposase-like protein